MEPDNVTVNISFFDITIRLHVCVYVLMIYI